MYLRITLHVVQCDHSFQINDYERALAKEILLFLLAFASFVGHSLFLGLCPFRLLVSVSCITSGGEFCSFGAHPRTDPVLAAGGL